MQGTLVAMGYGRLLLVHACIASTQARQQLEHWAGLVWMWWWDKLHTCMHARQNHRKLHLLNGRLRMGFLWCSSYIEKGTVCVYSRKRKVHSTVLVFHIPWCIQLRDKKVREKDPPRFCIFASKKRRSLHDKKGAAQRADVAIHGSL